MVMAAVMVGRTTAVAMAMAGRASASALAAADTAVGKNKKSPQQCGLFLLQHR
jgi:hypothetical protein